MKIKILYLLIIGCFIISVGASVAAQEKGAIKGRVVDAQTGEGLAEASVSIPGTGWATGSGERGDFAFEAMPPGVYRIAVRLFGYGGVSGQRVEVRRAGRQQPRCQAQQDQQGSQSRSHGRARLRSGRFRARGLC